MTRFRFYLTIIIAVSILMSIVWCFAMPGRCYGLGQSFQELLRKVQSLPRVLSDPEYGIVLPSILNFVGIGGSRVKGGNAIDDAAKSMTPQANESLSLNALAKVISIEGLSSGLAWIVIAFTLAFLWKRVRQPSEKNRKPARIQDVVLRPTSYKSMLLCELKQAVHDQLSLIDATRKIQRHKDLILETPLDFRPAYNERDRTSDSTNSPQTKYLQNRCQELEARNSALLESLETLNEEVSKNEVASKSISKSSLTIAVENRRQKTTIRSLQKEILKMKKEAGLTAIKHQEELAEVINQAKTRLKENEIQIQGLEAEEFRLKETLEQIKEELNLKELRFQAAREELRQDLDVANQKLESLPQILKESESNLILIKNLEDELKSVKSARDEAVKILDQMKLGMDDSTPVESSKENNNQSVDTTTPPRPNLRKRRPVEDATSLPLHPNLSKDSSIWTPDHPTHRSLPLRSPGEMTTSMADDEEQDEDGSYDGPADFSFTENGEVIGFEEDDPHNDEESPDESFPTSYIASERDDLNV